MGSWKFSIRPSKNAAYNVSIKPLVGFYAHRSTSKPKNARSKRALDARQPKEIEDARTTVFVKGTHTGEVLNSVMRELVSVIIIYPFPSPAKIESLDGSKTSSCNRIQQKKSNSSFWHYYFNFNFVSRVLGEQKRCFHVCGWTDDKKTSTWINICADVRWEGVGHDRGWGWQLGRNGGFQGNSFLAGLHPSSFT